MQLIYLDYCYRNFQIALMDFDDTVLWVDGQSHIRRKSHVYWYC